MSAYTKLVTGNEIAQALASRIRGKTVLVTGGTLGGLGTEFAATIAKHAPKLVILTARSQAKKETPDAPLRSLILDMSSLKDVRRAAAKVNAYEETVDVLVHNAGVAGVPLSRNEQGIEMHLVTNHIGPFLFTKLVLPKMLAGPKPPRIVVVSSGAHISQCSGIRWHDPNYLKEEEFGMSVYGESKAFNVLFASALTRRSGGKVEAFSLSPGWINSQLSRHVPAEVKKKMGFYKEDGTISDKLGPLQKGIRPYLVAAFDPEIPKTAPGAYFSSDLEPNPATGVAEWAKGEENEDKMWTLSEELIDEKFSL